MSGWHVSPTASWQRFEPIVRRRRGAALSRRRAQRAFAACALVGALALQIPLGSHAGATIKTDKQKIAALEQRIGAEGAEAQTLVTRYNQVDAHLLQLQHELAADHVQLNQDRTAESRASTKVRQFAIDAYVNAASGSSSPLTGFAGTKNVNDLNVQSAYLEIASGSLDSAIAGLQVDQHRTTVTATTLQIEQDETAAALRQLSTAKQAAQVAISTDQATLGNVNENLLALVTAAAIARQRQQAEQEEERLAQQGAPAAPTAAAPVTVVHPTPGSYSNPLRDARGIVSERIDQGVDYDGFGPIYAIGDGVVISTFNGGWPGGTFITYRLSDGPAAGLTVYAAEDIQPTVHIGQQVTANTVLGQIYEGSTGIETGWADGSGDGETMAADNGQYYGSNTTAFGANFSALLSSLGAPGGVAQNSPPTGSLPGSWPSW